MKTIRALSILAIIYFSTILIGFLIYVALIRSPILCNLSILFYRGIVLAGITVLILPFIAVCGRRWLSIDLATLVGACGLSLAFNICFLVLFPVTFDRSITIFLLTRIEQQDRAFNPRSLEQMYVREYLGNMRQIDRRITEQQISGNIKINKGRISITTRGRQVVASARLIGGWFNADPRIVGAQPGPHGGTAQH